MGFLFFVKQLMRQSCLKKHTMQSIMKRIHEAKEKGLVGQKLFDSVLQQYIPPENITTGIKNIIWFVYV